MSDPDSRNYNDLRLKAGISPSQARFALSNFCLTHFGAGGQDFVDMLDLCLDVNQLQEVLKIIREEVRARYPERLPALVSCVREANDDGETSPAAPAAVAATITAPVTSPATATSNSATASVSPTPPAAEPPKRSVGAVTPAQARATLGASSIAGQPPGTPPLGAPPFGAAAAGASPGGTSLTATQPFAPSPSDARPFNTELLVALQVSQAFATQPLVSAPFNSQPLAGSSVAIPSAQPPRSFDPDLLRLTAGVSLAQARFVLAEFCLDVFGARGQQLIEAIDRCAELGALQRLVGVISAEVRDRYRDSLPKLIDCIREINETG